MGSWTEEDGSQIEGLVSLRALYNDDATVVTIQVRAGDANDTVGITIGSEVAAIVADALDATNEFSSIFTGRTYQADYASYTP